MAQLGSRPTKLVTVFSEICVVIVVNNLLKLPPKTLTFQMVFKIVTPSVFFQILCPKGFSFNSSTKKWQPYELPILLFGEYGSTVCCSKEGRIFRSKSKTRTFGAFLSWCLPFYLYNSYTFETEEDRNISCFLKTLSHPFPKNTQHAIKQEDRRTKMTSSI